jgi:hypothetical protein
MARVKHSRPHDRFHGRVSGAGQRCQRPGCPEAGEFRAPGERTPGFDGPGDYRWFCLDHVREFNAGYDWFKGMTPDEILRAQSPLAGWDTHVRSFRPDAGIDAAPRWADYADPLEAMGLGFDADRKMLRSRYSHLVRKYHPDRNGGDRSHEGRLQAVVEAYNRLKRAAAFA